MNEAKYQAQKEISAAYAKQIRQLEPENVQMRQRIAELEAENERLHQNIVTVTLASKRRKNENEQLRSALKNLLDACDQYTYASFGEAEDAAREALEGDEDG